MQTAPAWRRRKHRIDAHGEKGRLRLFRKAAVADFAGRAAEAEPVAVPQ